MPHDITKTASEIENVDWSTGTGSGQHYTTVRFGSGSSQASQSSGDICRICHCESDPKNPLLTPCYCAGSLKYVHQACLQQWLTASETNSCELCKFPFIMHTKIKPFNEWRSLDISGVERRRLCCSVLFHCAAALCVIWSLCVLIERAADDVKRGLIDWPFWTKLAVVTVGLTGGVVFMYIQCKAYLHLCHRWKARNRILLIQNAPEKVHSSLHPSSSARQQQNRSALSQDPHSTSRATTDTNASQAICIAANPMMPPEGVCFNNSESETSRLARHNNDSGSAHHHVLQRIDVGTSSAVRIIATAESGDNGLLSAPPGQIVANIECSQSQHNYERDWALDDVVSQISSFRPCPQGSGSMTPFLDSIHNVLEHSQSSSHGSVNDVCGSSSRHDLSTGGISTDTGREHAMQLSSFSGSGVHKEPSISSCVSSAVANGLGSFVYKTQPKRYSNSSIFLENRDILNDSVILGVESNDSRDPTGSAKSNYRHSCVLTTPELQTNNLGKFVANDLRRYSDTKLLASDSNLLDPITFKTPANSDDNNVPPSSRANAVTISTQQRQHSMATTARILDVQLPTSPLTPLLVFDGRQIHKKTNKILYRSVQTVDLGEHDLNAEATDVASALSSKQGTEQQIDRARLFFKSLPNLSSSCESLIKK